MKGEELYLIYEAFTEKLVDKGWQGRYYNWKEVIESEVGEGTSMSFQYGNGLNVYFEEKENGEAKLIYWFEDPKSAVEVTTLEQLLEIEHIN